MWRHSENRSHELGSTRERFSNLAKLFEDCVVHDGSGFILFERLGSFSGGKRKDSQMSEQEFGPLVEHTY